MDHTLWDFQKNSKAALKIIFNKYNLSHYIESFELFYRVYFKINNLYWEKYKTGKTKKEELRLGRFNDTFTFFKIYNKNLAKKIALDYIKISPYQTKLIPDTKKILSFLSNKLPLHILTNGFSEIQKIKLENTQILKYFQTITCSDEIGINKPDIRLFEYFENKIKVKPSELILIGDDFESDILGAKNAGWQYIYFSNRSNKNVLTINKLNDLFFLFDSL